jgi:hypothetical protein
MIYLLLGMRQEIERPLPIIRTNSGQAAVEYILIVVIVVIIFLGLSVQFFKPMQTFIDASVGKYIECLLETGELPALGGESRIAEEAGCSAKLNAQAFKAGTLGPGSGGLGEGNSGGGSKKSSGGSDDKGQGGGGGATYAGSSGRSSIFSNNGKRGGLEGSSENPKIVEISLASAPEAGLRKGNSNAFSGGRRNAYKPVINYGLSSDEKDKVERELKSGTRVIASDLRGQTPKKISLKPPAKTEKKEAEEASMGFGDFLRYFLIAAIIIVLILLIGGQAARLAKGWEK